MKISVDCDGVLSNFTEGLVQVVNQIWPSRLPDGFEPETWGYDGIFTKEEFNQVWDGIRNTENFWRKLPAYEENVRALVRFLRYEQDHEIFFITSRIQTRGRPVAHQTESFLLRNGLWGCGNVTNILVVPKAGVKRFLMADLDIDVSIDDYGPTVAECNDVDGHRAYCLDRPWNRDRDYGPRVTSLVQFLDILTGKPEEFFVH